MKDESEADSRKAAKLSNFITGSTWDAYGGLREAPGS